jgi:hypothetical protein
LSQTLSLYSSVSANNEVSHTHTKEQSKL